MSDRIFILTKRPSTIKTIHTIELEHPSTPMENRKDPKFLEYHNKIWKELDNHV